MIWRSPITSKAINFRPNFADAYFDRGYFHIELGRYDLAIADYNKVIQLEPNSSDAYVNRGISYAELEKHDLAIADYKQSN